MLIISIFIFPRNSILKILLKVQEHLFQEVDSVNVPSGNSKFCDQAMLAGIIQQIAEFVFAFRLIELQVCMLVTVCYLFTRAESDHFRTQAFCRRPAVQPAARPALPGGRQPLHPSAGSLKQG